MSTPTATPVIRFEDVSLRFGDVVALDRISFQVMPGETRVIFGAAGAGKSQILKIALGLVRPDSGKVYLLGNEISRLRETELFEMRAHVGVLFQEGGLFDSQNIAENVAYPLVNQPTLQALTMNGGKPVEQRVLEALEFVELAHTLAKFPNELSGGMRRRVGIARAVVTEPSLVLYDSPTAGLDPITANTIITLLVKERDQRNTAALMVTHRYQDGHLMANFRYNPTSERLEAVARGGAAHFSTKFFVMNEGKLVFEGTEDELQASQDAYVRRFLRPGAS